MMVACGMCHRITWCWCANGRATVVCDNIVTVPETLWGPMTWKEKQIGIFRQNPKKYLAQAYINFLLVVGLTSLVTMIEMAMWRESVGFFVFGNGMITLAISVMVALSYSQDY